MKTAYWSGPRVLAFSVFHSLGTIGIILLLALLVGCIKKPDVENIDFGPETTRDALNNQLIDALGNRSWLDSQKGDFAVYQITIQPFTEGWINGGINSYEVVDRNDIGEEVELQLLHRIYEPDGTLKNEQAQTCTIHKGTLVSKCLFSEFNYLIPGTGTLHNLRTSFRTEDPDPELKNASNCSGIPNCKFTVKHIEYDLVYDRNNPEGRVNYSIDLGYESAYFAIPLKWCMRQHQDYNGRYIPVTQCRTLKKLKYGNAQPTQVGDIQSALQSALSSRPLANSKIGDVGVHYIVGRSAGQSEFSGGFEMREVTSKVDQGSHYDLGIQIRYFDQGGNAGATEQETCQVQKTGDSHNCAHASNPYSHLTTEPGQTTQFLNYTLGHYLADPPESVKERPNCGGVPGCKVNYTVLRFQKKITKAGTTWSTYHIVEISPDIPPLSATSFQCSGGLQGGPEAFAPFLKCDYLTDFAHGN